MPFNISFSDCGRARDGRTISNPIKQKKMQASSAVLNDWSNGWSSAVVSAVSTMSLRVRDEARMAWTMLKELSHELFIASL